MSISNADFESVFEAMAARAKEKTPPPSKLKKREADIAEYCAGWTKAKTIARQFYMKPGTLWHYLNRLRADGRIESRSVHAGKGSGLSGAWLEWRAR